jgi:hypothetical protein
MARLYRPLWTLPLLAGLVLAGCQRSAPPPLPDNPPPGRLASAEPSGPAGSSTPGGTSPTGTGGSGGGPGGAPGSTPGGETALACQVGGILADLTTTAIPHAHNAAALAKDYQDAAAKIRAVGSQAAGTRLAPLIANVAAAVDGIARHFATGALTPPDHRALDKAFLALPSCSSGGGG